MASLPPLPPVPAIPSIPTALASKLGTLFHDPAMFSSNKRWAKTGFTVEGEGRKSNVMVASHPAVPGYLFKKYGDKIAPRNQLKNYVRRAEGAAALRAFIAAQQISHIVAPQKFIFTLPPAFNRKGASTHLLVVEQLPLLTKSASKQLFAAMSNEVLRELCVVLIAFRGLDSGVRNVPFIKGGQIAFIDTERWDEQRKNKGWIRRIREYLSDDQCRFADALYKAAIPK